MMELKGMSIMQRPWGLRTTWVLFGAGGASAGMLTKSREIEPHTVIMVISVPQAEGGLDALVGFVNRAWMACRFPN